MGEEGRAKTPREERLAAKLRENLRRRKAQAREKHAEKADQADSGVPKRGGGG